MIFNKNPLPAYTSQEISSLFFFPKIMKDITIFLSAADLIDVLRENSHKNSAF